MSHTEFLPEATDFAGCLAHAVEECGEFLAAAGKTARFGITSVDPLLSEDDQEMNVDWLLREMADLQRALDRLRHISRVMRTDINDRWIAALRRGIDS